MSDKRTEVYEEIRRLSFVDSKAARQRLREMLDTNSDAFAIILDGAGKPGAGRIRQVVAGLLRDHPKRSEHIDTLRRWLVSETDEFARRSILAVVGTDISSGPLPAGQPSVVHPALTEAYRQTSAQFAHKMRNALEEPIQALTKMRNRAALVKDDLDRQEMQVAIASLRDGLNGVARLVAFDPEDDWFRVRLIAILDWIGNMNAEYAKVYRPIQLRIEPESLEGPFCIYGSDRLLELVFWNIWMNSHREVGPECYITLDVSVNTTEITLTIIDNGRGFDEDAVSVAFEQPFTTKSKGHGRGLLEIQSAVDELQGRVQIATLPGKGSRMILSFPLVTT